MGMQNPSAGLQQVFLQAPIPKRHDGAKALLIFFSKGRL